MSASWLYVRELALCPCAGAPLSWGHDPCWVAGRSSAPSPVRTPWAGGWHRFPREELLDHDQGGEELLDHDQGGLIAW